MTRRECPKTLREKPGVDAISYGGQAWGPKTTEKVRRGDYKLREIAENL